MLTTENLSITLINFNLENFNFSSRQIMRPNSADIRYNSRSPMEDEIMSETDNPVLSRCDSVGALDLHGKSNEEVVQNFPENVNANEENYKMASPTQFLSNSSNSEEKKGLKLLEAKRARVENIVTSIRDNTQIVDLSRSSRAPQPNLRNNFADTMKQARKRFFDDVISTELRNRYKLNPTLRLNDVAMTKDEECLRHKRRRIDYDDHALNLSSSNNSNNINQNRSSNEQSQTGNDVVNNDIISGETYEILVESLKQELMASLDVIAANSAKRVLEELKSSQNDFEPERIKTSEGALSDSRCQNSPGISVSEAEVKKCEESVKTDVYQENTAKSSLDVFTQHIPEQTEALSLVKRTSAFSSPMSRPFVARSNLDSRNRNYVTPTPYGSSKPPLANFNLPKSEVNFYQDSKLPSQFSRSFPPDIYNSPLVNSVFRRYPNFSASANKDPLSIRPNATPPTLNSALALAPNHLTVPLLQNFYHQQNLANALAEYERIGEGMDLRREKSHSTRTSTRESPRNQAYTRIQQEPKAESLKCRTRPVLGSDPLIMTSMQEGLNAHHLKKAKLMFFYTRYPNAITLKTYFPDVKFSRATTSQLIKWFSNFREFFYIQIEKFARQALNDGVTDPEQLHVERDSAIFRAINQHYNKSSDFKVPDEFVKVILKSLKEFFVAIQQCKDTDPSWKKPIYKVICKLDQHVPALFKLPNIIDHLSKIY